MIRYLVADLPRAAELTTRLEQMDRARQYTNGGPQLAEFEQKVAQQLDPDRATHAIGTSSGTAALEIALLALNLPPGSRVLTPALTFPATALAILGVGLTPMFADVETDSWMLTPDIARAGLASSRIAAVLPVSAFGRPQSARAWGEFATQTGTPVVIDAAGAFDAQDVDPRVLVAFSLHATKPFGIGEGGLLAVAPQLLDRARRLANFGFSSGVSAFRGMNAKMSEYAAIVGLAQLERWPGLQTKRKVLFAAYADAFAKSGVGLQAGSGDCAPASLVALMPVHNLGIAEGLAAKGIETRRSYLPPLHRHPAFADLPRCDLSATDDLAQWLLALPFHTSLSEADCRSVAAAVLDIAASS